MSDKEPQKREFKKYQQNRRLWDVAGSRYATLQDVTEAVEMGQDVTVVSVAGRGKTRVVVGDVTLQTLLDAFHDQQKARPTIKLEDIIRLIQGHKPTWRDR